MSQVYSENSARLAATDLIAASPLNDVETIGGGSLARARACSAVAHTRRASRQKVKRPSGKRDSANFNSAVKGGTSI